MFIIGNFLSFVLQQTSMFDISKAPVEGRPGLICDVGGEFVQRVNVSITVNESCKVGRDDDESLCACVTVMTDCN